jgi:hypothetical protein
MKNPAKILFLLIVLVWGSCVREFVPQTDEARSFLVVEGSITDQNNSYKIRISKSTTLGSKTPGSVVKGCVVYVSDDMDNKFYFKEKPSGTYSSDSLNFRGAVGRKYVLHITSGLRTYETFPIEMKPVPPIDSIYADIVYKNSYALSDPVPGYQVYLNTHDPSGQCNYYRWDFTETWEFRLPYLYESIKNRICWKTAESKNIFVKNTSSFKEDKIVKFPLNFITTETDRLAVKYSVLLRQYSLNQEEFDYWDKLQRLNEATGGLYDIVPMSIEGNIHCVNYPEEKVLGFFRVSSVSSKRLFITNKLTGFPDFYKNCPVDTVSVNQRIPGLNVSVFIIEFIFGETASSGTYVLTDRRECADCSVKGSTIMPPFWIPSKGDVVIKNRLK